MSLKLRDILKEKSSEYYGRLETLEKEAEDILPDIRLVFPKYTNHDIAHKKGVEEIIDKILPEKLKYSLNSTEIFYLLVATWFHDVGMKLMDQNEEKEFKKLNERDIEKFRDEIRKEHHERSSYYIIHNASELNLSNEEANAIAEISKSHRKIDIQNEIKDVIHKKRIRLKFLSAILRLADECHVTNDRISRLFLKNIKTTSWEFVNHFKKHELISGILFNENEDKKIRIGAIIESEDDEEVLKNLKIKIQAELDTIKSILEENNLFYDEVVFECNKNELIKTHIIFNLSDGGLKNSKRISKEINENISDVEKNLHDLKIDRTLWVNENNEYALNKDINSFEQLIKRFASNEKNYEFIKSKYAQKIIEKKLLSHLQYIYNIIYDDPDESEERLEILKTSPTAIYLSLFGKELFINPDLNLCLFQGSIVLDQILILGLCYDIYKYPISNSKYDNILESILEKTNDNFPDLMKLYNGARVKK